MRLARESWLLAAVCTLDLVTTIAFVNHRGAIEGNPVMGYFLTLGICAFVAAKLVLFLGPLAILEWARQYRPQFVTGMLRLAVVLYLGFYCVGVWRLNGTVDEAPGISAEQIATIEQAVSTAPTPEDLAAQRARVQTN